MDNIGIDNYISVGKSLRDRKVKEVMHALYEQVETTITLLDNEECEVVKFTPPTLREEGWNYGFDVKFKDSEILNHLEFSVTCTGWEIKG